MRKTSIAMVLGVLALLVVACGHAQMRGTVVMKLDPQEAHVCLGDREVKTGDRVALYKFDCTGAAGPKGSRSCRKVRIGEGTVTQTLNEHYSVIRVEPGVPFEEGTLVEKE